MGWRRGGAGQPLTRETEEQKNIRTEDLTFVLAAYRGNISYISFHKIHIRPLRGGRPRTGVRVASRNIRADAVARLGWPLTRDTEEQKDRRT